MLLQLLEQYKWQKLLLLPQHYQHNSPLSFLLAQLLLGCLAFSLLRQLPRLFFHKHLYRKFRLKTWSSTPQTYNKFRCQQVSLVSFSSDACCMLSFLFTVIFIYFNYGHVAKSVFQFGNSLSNFFHQSEPF